jgi:large subunit ribosomal protein L17
MRHRNQGRKLNRTATHRSALFASLATALIKHEQIVTTLPKAKDLRRVTERLITLAKRGDLHARRQALSTLAQDKFAVHKLFAEVAPRLADRPGGYSRIVRIGPRLGDAAEMAYLELVDFTPPAPRPRRRDVEEVQEPVEEPAEERAAAT